MMTMAQGARETRTAATANSVTAAAGAAGDYLTNEEAYKMLRGANSGVKPELGHRPTALLSVRWTLSPPAEPWCCSLFPG